MSCMWGHDDPAQRSMHPPATAFQHMTIADVGTPPCMQQGPECKPRPCMTLKLLTALDMRCYIDTCQHQCVCRRENKKTTSFGPSLTSRCLYIQVRYDPESEQPGSGRAYPRDPQFPDPRRGHRFQPSRGGYPNQQGAVREDAHWRAPNRHPQPHPTQWEPQV